MPQTTTDHTDEAGMTTASDIPKMLHDELRFVYEGDVPIKEVAEFAREYADLLLRQSKPALAASPAPSAPAAVPEELRVLLARAIKNPGAYAGEFRRGLSVEGWQAEACIAALSTRTPAGAAGDLVGELCPYDVGPGCPCRPCACHLGREGRKPAPHPNSPATRPASPAPAASAGGELAQCPDCEEPGACPELGCAKGFNWNADNAEPIIEPLAPAAPSGLPGREEIDLLIEEVVCLSQSYAVAAEKEWSAERPRLFDRKEAAVKRLRDAILAARPVADGVAPKGEN